MTTSDARDETLALLAAALAVTAAAAQTAAGARTARAADAEAAATPRPLAPLAWLEGCWRGTAEPARVPRALDAAARRDDVGVSQTVDEGQDAGLRIPAPRAAAGRRLLRRASPSGKAETAFRFEGETVDKTDERNDAIFTFVNPAQEFPQQIAYRRAHGRLALRDGRGQGRRRRAARSSIRCAASTANRASSSRVDGAMPPPSALANFEKMLAAGKDGALLRFSLGNEYLKVGRRGARRGASRARRRARPRVHRGVEALRQGARRGRPRRRMRSPPIAPASRSRQAGRQAGGEGDAGVRAAAGEVTGRRRASGNVRRPRAQPAAGSAHPLIDSTPRLASASARSLPGWPLWPLTQCHRMSCRAASASSSRHSSAFLTGFRSAVFQPFLFQPWIQVSMPFFTYCESV